MLVLLGAPGAGKGTQADALAAELGIAHIATGDLFRSAVRDATPLGLSAKAYMDRGELVPDDLTVRMLLDRLAAREARNGAILDGFPRTRIQARALDAALTERGHRVERALYIEVAMAELTRRLSGRWICETGGHTYHVDAHPPRIAGRCDVDGSPLIQREDDRIETVRARLAQQLPPLGEVLDHYRELGILVTVDGGRPISAVTADLLAATRQLAARA